MSHEDGGSGVFGDFNDTHFTKKWVDSFPLKGANVKVRKMS